MPALPMVLALLTAAWVVPAAAAPPRALSASGLANCLLPDVTASSTSVGERRPLTFGVTDNHPTAATLPLLERLKGTLEHLGVHDYTGPGRSAAYLRQVYPQLHRLARHGYPVTLDIGVGSSPHESPQAFVGFVRRVVRTDGPWLHAVEITNEPDVPSPTTSDGADPQIVASLVEGVVAAKSLARALGLRLRVGFNVAYAYGADASFWARLALQASAAFRHDVDWVGLHTYPNLLSTDTPVNGTDQSIERLAMATTRACMTAVGLGARVPIVITEVGYPTSRGPAEYDAQRDYWRRVLTTVGRYGPRYGVTGLFAFLLQDAPSTAAVGGGYGLFDQHGRPKPAQPTVTRLFERYGSANGGRRHPPPFVPVSYRRIDLPHRVQPWGMTWTPDGRHILFENQLDGYQAWVVRADGSRLRCITCGMSDAPRIGGDVGAMMYAFPGDRRLFISDDTGSTPPADPPFGASAYVVECRPSIFRCHRHDELPVDMSADEVGVHPVLLRRTWHLAPDGVHLGWMDVRTDGTMLVVGRLVRERSQYDVTDLRVVNPAAPAGLTDDDAARRAASDEVFELKSFADGGRDVVVVGEPDAINPDQELVDLRTGKVTRLTANVDWDEDGGLSPDGRYDLDASYRGMHGTDVFGALPEIHPFIDFPVTAGLAGYYVGGHEGFQCDLTPWLLPAAGDDGGRLMGQPLGPYRGGPSYVANDFLGQQVWSPDSTEVLLQQRVYGPARGTTQQADMGTSPSQILIAHLRIPPRRPIPVVSSVVGSWAKPPLTFDSGMDQPGGYVVHGAGRGTATVTSVATVLSSVASLTYRHYSDDGKSFVSGTETVSNPFYVGAPVHWTMHVTLSGAQTGSEDVDLDIDGTKTHGSATTVVDGATLHGPPRLGACPRRMPHATPLRVRVRRVVTRQGRRLVVAVTASIPGAGRTERLVDTRPVEGALVEAAGVRARTGRRGVARLPLAVRNPGVVRVSAGATFSARTIRLPRSWTARATGTGGRSVRSERLPTDDREPTG
ncbi:MAG TPA: hypothetical protein VG899_02100 [Mycobacteriales bacterium]|nr:hypothetical protein [Mycobacteriales bacterium]